MSGTRGDLKAPGGQLVIDLVHGLTPALGADGQCRAGDDGAIELGVLQKQDPRQGFEYDGEEPGPGSRRSQRRREKRYRADKQKRGLESRASGVEQHAEGKSLFGG